MDDSMKNLLGPWDDDEEAKFQLNRPTRQESPEQDTRAAIQNDLDRIDSLALSNLKGELTALRSQSRTTKRARHDYAAFCAYALKNGWPNTAPQSIFAFLTSNIHRGYAYVKRLHKSIGAVQASVGHKNSAGDLMNLALLKKLEAQAKDNDKAPQD